MPFNGSGVFNRIYSWVADKAAGLDISSTRMDTDTNDIAANGFGNCITRDGQGQPTANLPMAGFRHTGAGAGIARTDYAALSQAQDGLLGWTIATGSADAITATYTPSRGAPSDGSLYSFRAIAANATTTPTFAPDGQTARTITRFGGGAAQPGDIPGALAESWVRYNLANTRWELLNPANPVNNAVIGGTSAATVPAGTTAQRPGVPAPGNWRLNTSIGAFEGYNGAVWLSVGRAPVVQEFTSGTGTYTPTSGAVRIRVMMCGGGGGGGGGGGSGAGSGGAGGLTSLGTWSAGAGGGGAANNSQVGGQGGGGGSAGTDGTGTRIRRVSGGGGASGASSNASFNLGLGGSGGSNPLGGAGQSQQSVAGFTGAGGAGGSNGSIGTFGQGGGGGAGEYVEFWVSSPGSLAYAVGAAGAAGTAGSGSAGNAGAASRITIEEFFA